MTSLGPAGSSPAVRPQRKRFLRTIMDGTTLVLSALTVLALINACFFQWVRVEGTSMENTLHDGEILLAARLGEYRRGEVVICRYPRRTEGELSLSASIAVTRYTVFVKRLVALPGDTVEIRQGLLYVNGEAVPNPPGLGSLPRDYPPRKLGPDQYFVVGDNRASSHDSRSGDVGPISGKMLQGHVLRVLWPLGMGRKVE